MNVKQITTTIRIGLFLLALSAILWGWGERRVSTVDLPFFEVEQLLRPRSPAPAPAYYQPILARPVLSLPEHTALKPRETRTKGLDPLWHVPTMTAPVVTEALDKIGANEHHGRYRGAGVRVAVIDDGFAGWQARVAAGELPATVVTRQFLMDGRQTRKLSSLRGSHGAACAEIIHDIAPEAQIYLVQVESFVGTLASVLDYLRSEDVQIVSLSLSVFPQGRGDGRGNLGVPPVPVYDLLAQARRDGILIVKSAGNYAQQHYAGVFSDRDGDGWHEFDEAGDETLSLHVYRDADFQLYLSSNGVGDYDLRLFDLFGKEVGRSAPMAADVGYTAAGAGYTAAGLTVSDITPGLYRIKINGADPGAAPLGLFVIGEGVVMLEHRIAQGSLGAPADSPDVLTVAAANVFTDELIASSSQGPAADGRIKPNITGYTNLSVYDAESGSRRFYGTSPAAPYIAGVAALIAGMPGNAGIGPDALQAEILNFAADKGAPGPDPVWGAGIVRLLPYDFTVGYLTATLAASTADRLYTAIYVNRTNGAPLRGLTRADFSAIVGGQTARVVTVRDMDDYYILEILPLNLRNSLTVKTMGASRDIHFQPLRPGRGPVPALHAAIAGDPYLTGDAIWLLVSLSDSAPIAGAHVLAQVRRPDHQRDTFALFDDGMHGDGLAGDGVYGGAYRRTTVAGRYRLEVSADVTPTAATTLDVRVSLSPYDRDGDDLPDNWERAVGLQDNRHEGYQDPDGDGLTNREEYLLGTDPFGF